MKKLVFCFLIIFASILHAKILDIYHISDLQNFMKEEDSLVVFDIDNTLMEPVQTIGSDQWFDRRMKKLSEGGSSSREVLLKVYDEWHKIQTVCEVKLVENDTKKVFDGIKEKYNVIALTTRGFQSAYNTLTQLEGLGIVFDNKPYIAEEIFFQNGNESGVYPGVLFFKGILFTNNTHKGEALFKLLEKFNKKPKTIIFINDKRSHLDQVEESSNKRNVSFVGLRYGFTDEKVKKFDPNLANMSKIDFGSFIKEKEKEAAIKK